MKPTYINVNYHYGDGKHFNESLENGFIGIPDKTHTKGKRIFEKASSQKPLYGTITDISSGKVIGIFTTFSGAFHGSSDPFTGDPKAPNEHWGHRIFAGITVRYDKKMSINEFRALGGVVNRGSVNIISKEVWNKARDFFTSP